jgi:homoserine dehydrogenase
MIIRVTTEIMEELTMDTLKIAMLGFGNSGRALSRIIIDKQIELIQTMGSKLIVVAIATASRGNLIDDKGIDLEKALKDISLNGCFDRKWDAFSELTTKDIIEKVDYDVLIEITPLNIFTGQPAIDNINTAFKRKKHVITANKGPIAWAYNELRDFSKKQEVIFLYETTVMDGTPIFNLVEETLPMCKVKEIRGILNTTTNFVLEEMSKGKDFNAAIAEGQKRGFVEADPAMDIEGWDAAAKLTALINVLMEGNITPPFIKRKGIENITYEDIANAAKENKVIKLLCHASIENGVVVGEVKPEKLEKNSIYANICGTSSVLSIKTDLMGEITILEHDPEIEQTGYGLFSDLIRMLSMLQKK